MQSLNLYLENQRQVCICRQFLRKSEITVRPKQAFVLVVKTSEVESSYLRKWVQNSQNYDGSRI